MHHLFYHHLHHGLSQQQHEDHQHLHHQSHVIQEDEVLRRLYFMDFDEHHLEHP